MKSEDFTSHPSPTVLILVDVITHFEFPNGESLRRQALRIAPRIAQLKKRARRAKVATIYVNDNFGQWRSDASKLLAYCLRPESKSRSFVEQIEPEKEDYLVLKPMHSAFYQTPLEVLLRHLKASTLVLCGLATNSCIICTAHDADMRGFKLFVPSDCSAARTPQEHQQALRHVHTMSNADIKPSISIRF